MGSQQTLKPSGTVKIPSNYPTDPTPGKLELLLNSNDKPLYHKFSPYTDYHNGLLSFGKEPYLYTYIDEKSSGLNAIRKYDSRVFPVGSSLTDVLRVGKFLTSGRGITFLAKQFLLQTGAAYNETRVYNPTSPLVAAGRGATLNLIGRPSRAFDTSAGLSGLLSSLIGVGDANINPPSGTTGTDSLPIQNVKSDGKGLSRAQTANKGLAHFQSKWGMKAGGTGFIKTMFSNFIPESQNGIQYKSSEGAYGIMLTDKGHKLSSYNKYGVEIPLGQQWVGGSKGIRKNLEYVTTAIRNFIDADGHLVGMTNDKLSNIKIEGLGTVGYSIDEHSLSGQQYRYGDNVGTDISDEYASSDILIQFKDYVDSSEQYPSKFTSTDKVSNQNADLLKVLNNIKSANNGLYTVKVDDNSRIIGSGNADDNGYDRLFKVKNKGDSRSGINYNGGLLKSYRDSGVKTVDESISTSGNSLRLPTSNRFDAMNTLTVIDAATLDDSDSYAWESQKMKGWENTRWYPLIHDQVAFYFYDVVNANYLPFRATFSGINESADAKWESLSFIGRSDMTYAYSGFTRALSFKFTIHIGSIAELAPTWQRINYLMTLTKPANYTRDDVINKSNSLLESDNIANTCMIPPMILMTMGDLYNNQPIILNNVAMSIPDDASWETVSSDSNEDWSYLAGYIKSPRALSGQLPRTIDISVNMNLLEKEMPIVGGNNFGHAPRKNIFKQNDWNTSIPLGKSPNKFNKSLIVDVNSV